jgi:hypothetical protein
MRKQLNSAAEASAAAVAELVVVVVAVVLAVCPVGAAPKALNPGAAGPPTRLGTGSTGPTRDGSGSGLWVTTVMSGVGASVAWRRDETAVLRMHRDVPYHLR